MRSDCFCYLQLLCACKHSALYTALYTRCITHCTVHSLHTHYTTHRTVHSLHYTLHYTLHYIYVQAMDYSLTLVQAIECVVLTCTCAQMRPLELILALLCGTYLEYVSLHTHTYINRHQVALTCSAYCSSGVKLLQLILVLPCTVEKKVLPCSTAELLLSY
jgi:hypothetical protein